VQPEVYKGIRGTVPVGFDRDVWLTLPRERFAGLAAAGGDPPALRRSACRGSESGDNES
jgi:hypothetical protein